MDSKLLKAGCLALAASICGPSFLASAQGVEGMARALDPRELALRLDFECAVQDYQHCISAHPNDIRACDAQQAIMDAASRAYSGSAGIAVYVPPHP